VRCSRPARHAPYLVSSSYPGFLTALTPGPPRSLIDDAPRRPGEIRYVEQPKAGLVCPGFGAELPEHEPQSGWHRPILPPLGGHPRVPNDLSWGRPHPKVAAHRTHCT
jgi:hypothetical protein